MMDWLIVLIFVIVVLLVWLFLIINAKEDEPDIAKDIHLSGHGPDAIQEKTATAEAADLEASPNLEKVSVNEDVQVQASRALDVNLVIEDLTVIEGIGPKVNRVLHEQGISTFIDLAKTEQTRLREILDQAGYQYMDPGTWAEQAGLLVENRMQEFQELIKNLKGGKKSG